MDSKLLVIIGFLLGLTLIPPLLEHLTLSSLDEDEQQMVIKPVEE